MTRGAWTRKLALVEQRETLPSPLRLGVISDTHHSWTRMRRTLDPIVDLFRRARVDCILHAGDAGSSSVLRDLEAVAPVLAVRGNADPPELLDTLPDRVWISAGARTILLTHGHHGKTAMTTARAAASSNVDLIVFGHSHKPLIERVGQTILFNPGSPTERRWNPHFGIGLISVSDDAIDPEIILFDDPAHLGNINP